MAYDNRPNLSCRQFEQRGFDYLYLGGHNCICGTGGTISSNSGYGISGVTILSTGKQLHTLQIGCNSVASGASTAIGAATHALGVATLAIGCGACAFRNNSIALGSQTKACSNYSISIGYDNISCAENSNILGGCGNVICSASTGTVLIGFNNQTIASSSYSGHVIVPNLTILTVPSGTGSVLCRSSNGKIELTCGGATNDGILKFQSCTYQPYSAITTGKLYSGSTNPISTASRLNYDGQFYGTTIGASDCLYINTIDDGSTSNYALTWDSSTCGIKKMSYVNAFTGLTDTPNSYTAKYLVRANTAGNAIDYISAGDAISDILPIGLKGETFFINQDATNISTAGFTVVCATVVENNQELTIAQGDVVTLEEIFNTWYKFSHWHASQTYLDSYYSSYAPNYPTQTPPKFPASDPENSYAPFTADDITGTTTQVWKYGYASWVGANAIYTTANYSSVIGFVSPDMFDQYTIDVKLGSNNSDDDYIGLVLGFYKDPDTNFEYTLTTWVNTVTVGGVLRYAITYNFGQNPTTQDTYNPIYSASSYQVIVDGTSKLTAPSGGGWASNSPVRMHVVRNGDYIQVKVSQYGSTTIDDNTLLEIDMKDYPVLQKFRGPSRWGVMASSQENSAFYDLYFSGFGNYIFYNKGTYHDTYEYDNDTSTWFLQSPQTLTLHDYIGIGRIVNSKKFGKLYYTEHDGTVTKLTSPLSGGTGGGITGATNLGIGNGTLYTDISNGNLQFKSLSAGTNITLSCNANYVTINSTASGSESGIGWSNLVNGSTIAGCGTVASASTINCNTAFGVCALGSITSSACSNVGIGYKTLQALTTRCNNTAIGNYAGYSATGNSNVFIGHCAGYNETGSGKLYIATGATNPLIYGDFVNKYVQINGSIIEPYISISSGATVNWDAYAGTNRTLTAGSSFILNLTNLINGMQGDLRLNVTNILSITLPTSKLNGSVIDLTIGVYHITWTYDGSNLEFSIAKYV